ncbi:unnamed protein product [Amoebophrya sp. A120]|nr:unnamed protein product [Amoebophrya sp. A120]|eukprot:GSA120T00000985001.1
MTRIPVRRSALIALLTTSSGNSGETSFVSAATGAATRSGRSAPSSSSSTAKVKNTVKKSTATSAVSTSALEAKSKAEKLVKSKTTMHLELSSEDNKQESGTKNHVVDEGDDAEEEGDSKTALTSTKSATTAGKKTHEEAKADHAQKTKKKAGGKAELKAVAARRTKDSGFQMGGLDYNHPWTNLGYPADKNYKRVLGFVYQDAQYSNDYALPTEASEDFIMAPHMVTATMNTIRANNQGDNFDALNPMFIQEQNGENTAVSNDALRTSTILTDANQCRKPQVCVFVRGFVATMSSAQRPQAIADSTLVNTFDPIGASGGTPGREEKWPFAAAARVGAATTSQPGVKPTWTATFRAGPLRLKMIRMYACKFLEADATEVATLDGATVRLLLVDDTTEDIATLSTSSADANKVPPQVMVNVFPTASDDTTAKSLSDVYKLKSGDTPKLVKAITVEGAEGTGLAICGVEIRVMKLPRSAKMDITKTDIASPQDVGGGAAERVVIEASLTKMRDPSTDASVPSPLWSRTYNATYGTYYVNPFSSIYTLGNIYTEGMGDKFKLTDASGNAYELEYTGATHPLQSVATQPMYISAKTIEMLDPSGDGLLFDVEVITDNRASCNSTTPTAVCAGLSTGGLVSKVFSANAANIPCASAYGTTQQPGTSPNVCTALDAAVCCVTPQLCRTSGVAVFNDTKATETLVYSLVNAQTAINDPNTVDVVMDGTCTFGGSDCTLADDRSTCVQNKQTCLDAKTEWENWASATGNAVTDPCAMIDSTYAMSQAAEASTCKGEKCFLYQRVTTMLGKTSSDLGTYVHTSYTTDDDDLNTCCAQMGGSTAEVKLSLGDTATDADLSAFCTGMQTELTTQAQQVDAAAQIRVTGTFDATTITATTTLVMMLLNAEETEVQKHASDKKHNKKTDKKQSAGGAATIDITAFSTQESVMTTVVANPDIIKQVVATTAATNITGVTVDPTTITVEETLNSCQGTQASDQTKNPSDPAVVPANLQVALDLLSTIAFGPDRTKLKKELFCMDNKVQYTMIDNAIKAIMGQFSANADILATTGIAAR